LPSCTSLLYSCTTRLSSDLNDSLLPNYFIKKANQLVIQLTDFISGKFSNENRYDAYKISVQRTLFQTSHILFKNKEEAKTYIDLDRKSTRLNSSHVSISYAV